MSVKKASMPVADAASSADSLSANSPAVPWLGWVIAVSASLCFSFAPVVGRSAILSGMEPTELLVWRFLTAVVLVWLVRVLLTQQAVTGESGSEAISARSLSLICLVGLLNGAGMIFFFFALARLDASMTSMVLSTLPVLVLIILAFFGEPLTQRKVARLILAMVGLYLLIGPGGEVDMIGVALVICAVLLFGSQLVMTQSLVRKHDPQTVTRYVMTVMLAVIFVYWWFQDGQLNMPTAEGWLYVVLLGVISTFAARLLLYAAVRRVGSGQMSLLMPLETLFSITWSVLYLNERLSLIQWIGGLLILTSAILAVRRIRLGDRPLRWRVWGRA